MKYFWWAIPLTIATVIMALNLSLLNYLVVIALLAVSCGLLVYAVEKYTREEIIGVDWPKKDKQP